MCNSLLDEKRKNNGEIVQKKVVLIKYDKEKVIISNSLYSIMNQLNFYKKYNYLNNPFISKVFYAFQDQSSFYLVKKFYSGGDLRYQMNRKMFSEEKSKFLIANIILGLEFIQSKGYIYRNLIPQNLVFDKKGYLHLNDMTLVREITDVNYLATSGHSGYMAPEIIFRQSYGIESDFFSLGVILYEIMFNKLPYKSKSKKEYLDDLSSSHSALIKEDELNIKWSRECADFINKCIQIKAELRIGFAGIEELKTHIWIKDFDWDKLKKKELIAPFIPRGKNNYSIRNREEKKSEFLENISVNFSEYFNAMDFFNGYFYNYSLDEKITKEKHNEEENIKNEKKIEKNDLIENIEEIDDKGLIEDEKINNVINLINANNIDTENEDNIKIKKKKKKNNEENNEYDKDIEELNINKNKKRKKNKKKKEEDEYEDNDFREKHRRRKSRKESIESKNFNEEESKGQLMNVNNKKGLFNKNGNRRKSLKIGKISKNNIPTESIKLYSRNKNSDNDDDEE